MKETLRSSITALLQEPTRFPSSAILFRSLTPEKIIDQLPVQFVSALAHEIRNPLATIRLAVELMGAITGEEDRQMYLDIILRASDRINEVVTELLTSIRTEEKEPENQSVHELLDEALNMTEDRIMLKNINVRKDYSTVDCKVRIDKPRMLIALTNIIINAIDAMSVENGRLKLVTKSINNQCVIEIEDNGTGIRKENLNNIFKPFFTDKPGGMGLGLAATREILLYNNAQIKVESKLGRGTRFIITFDQVK